MLVLTRYEGESITIGGNIEVTVLNVRRDGRVRLGITAPREIPVHRKEIQLKIDKEKGVANGTIVDMSSQTR